MTQGRDTTPLTTNSFLLPLSSLFTCFVSTCLLNTCGLGAHKYGRLRIDSKKSMTPTIIIRITMEILFVCWNQRSVPS